MKHKRTKEAEVKSRKRDVGDTDGYSLAGWLLFWSSFWGS